MKTSLGLFPLCNVANLVSKQIKRKKNIHGNLTFTLATDENPLEKWPTPNTIRYMMKKIKCLGELKAGILCKFQQKRESPWWTQAPSALIENVFLRARTAFGFEYLISFVAEHSDAEILRESNDFFSEIDKIDTKERENCLEDSNLAK